MKVEVNGKTYCVETLIADNERLRKDVSASADTIRLVLDSVRAEIEALAPKGTAEDVIDGNPIKEAVWETIYDVMRIIDKYKAESEVRND